MSKRDSVRRLSILSGYNHDQEGKFNIQDTSDVNSAQDYGEIEEIEEEVPWESGNLTEIKKYEIAITGKAFQMMMESIENPKETEENRKLNQALIQQAKVFARMSPDHKAMLVEQLQEVLNDMVGMCGDGANDCKALKTSDVGLSLSEAEASIAAPFTSKIPNISPIVKLLREGRTSLVTCFQVFKFMALYSMIQFINVIILYEIGSNIGNYEFLYVDLLLVIPLSLTMSRTGPYKKLDKSRPIGHLISFTVLFSVIGQIVLVAGFQGLAYYFLQLQSWYKPLVREGDLNIA